MQKINKAAGHSLPMPSKIKVISRTEKIQPAFTCRYCGSHDYNVLSAIGRVAGRFEKRHLCLKCRRVNECEN